MLKYGEGEQKTITGDEDQVNLFRKEREFLSTSFDLPETNESTADFVIHWEIPKLKKVGFYTLHNVCIKSK